MKNNMEYPLKKDEAWEEAEAMKSKLKKVGIDKPNTKDHEEASKKVDNESYIRHHLVHALLQAPKDIMACTHFFGHFCPHKSTFGGNGVILRWGHFQRALNPTIIVIIYLIVDFFKQLPLVFKSVNIF